MRSTKFRGFRSALAITVLAPILASGCATRNSTPVATTGSIAGDVTINGPFNGAADLQAGVFAPGSDAAVQTADAGHITSAATVTLAGRKISFSFASLPFGTYQVGIYVNGPAAKTFIYRSGDLVLSAATPTVSGFTATGSFTGAGPFGTISGLALLSNDFTFPSGGDLTFVGFSPVADPANVLQLLVTSADVSNHELFFNADTIAYGDWNVGLYGYNPTTHNVTVFGVRHTPITVSASSPNVTGAVFGADNSGGPATDPVLGSISGTVTFNGTLPAGQAIFIAANTIPPQQGAPPSSVPVAQADVAADHTLHYTLPLLPNGDYAVSIFSYDITTHTAVYFGQAASTVTLTAAAKDVTGIDFNADVTLIGGGGF